MDDAGNFYCALGWAFADGKGKPESEYNKTREIFASCAGAAIYRKEILDEIGYFDEEHFAYLEDVDIGYRAKLHGYRNLFCPTARVLHVGSGTSGSRYNLFKIRYSSRNNLYLIYKNMPLWQIILNFPLLFVGFTIKTVFFASKGFGKDYIKGMWNGIVISKENKEKKVRNVAHQRERCWKIQLELYKNIGKRFRSERESKILSEFYGKISKVHNRHRKKYREETMKIQVGKKELSEKQKKILRKVKVILQYVFIFLSLLIATTVAWVFRTWKGLTMEEVVFQIQAPTTGTDSGIISSFILTCPLISIVLTLVILLLHKRLGKIKDIAVLGLMVAFLAVAAFSVGYMWNRLDITAYAKNQTTESTFIEDNYADPKEVELTFPVKKRNLIYIYLESMEDTYADKKSGGAFEKSRIPELAKLSLENENFSGNSTALNGGIPMYGATWTMGALFAQTSGLPLNLPIRGDLMSTQSEFLPGVINLGDILEENGYKQYFLMGSEAEFAGRDLYYKQHGNYTIYDYNYSLENGEIPEDYHVFWGYEDAKLFEFAKQHLTQISKNNEPFNFSMLTVDTHFEDGYRCKDCPNTFGDDQYANVMACSSKKVTEFVKWIQEQDFYENTNRLSFGRPSDNGQQFL